MHEPRDEILETWVGTARLLRAHRVPVPNRSDWKRALRIQLTFDVGGLALSSSHSGSEVSVETMDADLSADGLEDAMELDPWWTVMGETLTGAWIVRDLDGDPRRVELQFRNPADNPKTIHLESRDLGLRIGT